MTPAVAAPTAIVVAPAALATPAVAQPLPEALPPATSPPAPLSLALASPPPPPSQSVPEAPGPIPTAAPPATVALVPAVPVAPALDDALDLALDGLAALLLVRLLAGLVLLGALVGVLAVVVGCGLFGLVLVVLSLVVGLGRLMRFGVRLVGLVSRVVVLPALVLVVLLVLGVLAVVRVVLLVLVVLSGGLVVFGVLVVLAVVISVVLAVVLLDVRPGLVALGLVLLRLAARLLVPDRGCMHLRQVGSGRRRGLETPSLEEPPLDLALKQPRRHALWSERPLRLGRRLHLGRLRPSLSLTTGPRFSTHVPRVSEKGRRLLLPRGRAPCDPGSLGRLTACRGRAHRAVGHGLAAAADLVAAQNTPRAVRPPPSRLPQGTTPRRMAPTWGTMTSCLSRAPTIIITMPAICADPSSRAQGTPQDASR